LAVAELGRVEAIGWGRALGEGIQDAWKALAELRSPLADLALAVIEVEVIRCRGRGCGFGWASQIVSAGSGGDRDFFSLGHRDGGWWTIFVSFVVVSIYLAKFTTDSKFSLICRAARRFGRHQDAFGMTAAEIVARPLIHIVPTLPSSKKAEHMLEVAVG
jgi:hypothetical protein